jgi:hypothetical protein
MLPSMKSIDRKIRIERGDIPDLQPLACRDDRRVCKIHRQIRIFCHKLNDSAQVNCYFFDAQRAAAQPGKEINGQERLEPKQVSHFGYHRRGDNAVKHRTEKEISRVGMIGVTAIKQRDEWSRVDGDSLFHE